MKSGSKLIHFKILGYKNTMKSVQDHVDPEDKRELSELRLNPNITICYVWKETRKT